MVTSRPQIHSTWDPSQCEDAPSSPQQDTQDLADKTSLCQNSVSIGDMPVSDYLEVYILR